jgi:hypothetical protein
MAANSQNTGAQALVQILKPLLAELEVNLEGKIENRFKNHTTAISFDLLQAINELKTRIDTLERCLAPGKKQVRKAKDGDTASREDDTTAKDGDPKEGAKGGKEGAKDGDSVDTDGSGDSKRFPNKMLWFKEQYKTNEAFRKECNDAITKLHPNFTNLMESDKSVSDKKTDAAKMGARASFAWKFLSNNAKSYLEAYEVKYTAAKAEHDQKNKPPANQADAGTPKH